jgi:hypothetical protein
MIKNSQIQNFGKEIVIYDTDKDNFEMIILKGSANLYQCEQETESNNLMVILNFLFIKIRRLYLY